MSKYIQILTVSFFSLLPFGNLLRVELFDTVQIVPQDILVGILSCLIFVELIKKPKLMFENKFFKLQAAFILTGIVSLFINVLLFSDISFFVAFLYPVRYFAYLSLVFLPNFIESQKLLKMAFISCVLFLMVGFLQFSFFFDLRPLFFFGWDDHLYRLTSSFFDPNFASVLLVGLFFVCLYYSSTKSFRSGYLYILVLFASVVGIYLTFSRTGIFALSIGLVSYLLFKKRLGVLVIAILSIFVLAFLFADTNTEGLNPLRSASISSRLATAKETLEIISKNPLFGQGLNGYRYAQVRYGVREKEGALMSNSDAGADNSFLFVTATTGIIGVILFLLSYFRLITQLLKKRSTFSLCVISFVISILASSFVNNIVFYMPIMGIVFTLVGIGVRYNLKADKLP